MGHSRDALATKIHTLIDADGLPIALKLTECQAHDGQSATDMLDTVEEGTILLADRAYDSDSPAPDAGCARRLGEHQADDAAQDHAGL